MKKANIFLVSLAVLVACNSSLLGDSGQSFKDYVVDKGIYSIVAETDMETALIPNSTFFPKQRISTLVDYCEAIGGAVSYNKKNLLDTNTPVVCDETNGRGFVATTNYPKKGYNDYVVIVEHKSAQTLGYTMKGYIKENDIDKVTSAKSFNKSMLDFGTNFYDYYAFCESKGGKYLVSNTETNGKAVGGAEYLLKGYMKGRSIYSEGTHWCVDTKEGGDTFTVAVTRHPFNGVMRFQPVSGVDATKIEKYSDALPWYTRKAPDQVLASTANGAVDNAVAMSKAPTQNENDLAAKVFKAGGTVLARQNGSVLEGIFLGQNDSGCNLVAVAKSVDRPYGHKNLYGGKSTQETVFGYKQCRDGKVDYIGESFETNFPVAIENEYNRVLDTCRIRGVAMGSYLGYNIDCQRQGATNSPIYELTIVKKDKLVVRTLEK